MAEQVRAGLKQVKMMSLLIPFASVSSGTDSLLILTKAVASFVKVVGLAVIVCGDVEGRRDD